MNLFGALNKTVVAIKILRQIKNPFSEFHPAYLLENSSLILFGNNNQRFHRWVFVNRQNVLL